VTKSNTPSSPKPEGINKRKKRRKNGQQQEQVFKQEQ